MRINSLLAGIILCFSALAAIPASGQGSDQILDGIEGTGLIDPGPDRNLPEFFGMKPQLYNAYLTGVQDVEVETVVGHLPRLPRFVKGVYSNNIEGPDVRVIWPSPVDNSQVLAPGTYTVTGRIAGSKLQPKAKVTVKAAEGSAVPHRTLEVFSLAQVSLDADINNHKSKFIENRDKFVNGLAATNPDNFLYMLRNAFGQEQPAGAEPMGGWDSQQTRLRGHATGHYLSALAQAYAGDNRGN